MPSIPKRPQEQLASTGMRTGPSSRGAKRNGDPGIVGQSPSKDGLSSGRPVGAPPPDRFADGIVSIPMRLGLHAQKITATTDWIVHLAPYWGVTTL
jgi:hypothetical protein